MKNILCVIIVMATALSASAKEYFKYTDQNGIETWVGDKSKIPPPVPTYYSYEDKNGITFWVNDISKIPGEFRNKSPRNSAVEGKTKLKAELDLVAKRQYSTIISMQDNLIIVPVVFTNKGRKVKARMILDTGASVTTIYSVLAADLRLHKNRRTKVKSISANGAKTDSMLTKVDYIEVDGKILAHPDVVVMPAHSNIGADGLLGNSFLRFFNFTIDYEKQLLKWN